MSVILQTLCQLQRTSCSFRYVNSGAARIQCIYSSAYSILNIRLNVSALLLEICRYLHACYTANLVPNTEPILRFTLCELWSRTYTIVTAPHIQPSIFIWTFLRCYWKYLDNSMLVILQTCFQIQSTSTSLRNATCGPGHIQSIFSTAYLGFNIQLKVAPQLL
jgi:hypothetical protein